MIAVSSQISDSSDRETEDVKLNVFRLHTTTISISFLGVHHLLFFV